MAEIDFNRINTNIGALNALNALSSVNRRLGIHQLRLATGKRLNSAADDAAGWTIAAKFKVQSEGLGVAISNIGDAKNLMAVSDGNLQTILDLLGQMKSKATQGANDALGSEERTALNNELNQLAAQIDEEVSKATWNGNALLSGTDTSYTFQVGAGTGDTITFDMRSSEVGYTSGYTAASLQVDQGAGTVTIGTASSYFVDPGGFDLNSIASSATINTGSTQLTEGYYTVQLTDAAGNSTSGVVTFRILDSEGNAVQISSSENGTGALASSATASYGAGGTMDAVFDTGRGLKFDLAGIASGDVGTFVVNFAKAGNNVSTDTAARAYMAEVDTAISNVNKALAYIGARTNRMSYAEQSLSISKVNSDAARSRISDADMAYEQFESTKLIILQQTATAMLAQANASPQSVLALFR